MTLPLLVLAAVASIPSQETGVAPTYHRDVAPIVLGSCAGCDQHDGSAPFPLTSYEDVRRRARQIVEVTASRFMPPWLPEPGYGSFLGERRLDEREIATFEAWARAGAPEGDPDEAPPAAPLGSGWQLGKPDLVVAMEETYTLVPRRTGRTTRTSAPTTASSTTRLLGTRVKTTPSPMGLGRRRSLSGSTSSVFSPFQRGRATGRGPVNPSFQPVASSGVQ